MTHKDVETPLNLNINKNNLVYAQEQYNATLQLVSGCFWQILKIPKKLMPTPISKWEWLQIPNMVIPHIVASRHTMLIIIFPICTDKH